MKSITEAIFPLHRFDNFWKLLDFKMTEWDIVFSTQKKQEETLSRLSAERHCFAKIANFASCLPSWFGSYNHVIKRVGEISDPFSYSGFPRFWCHQSVRKKQVIATICFSGVSFCPTKSRKINNCFRMQLSSQPFLDENQLVHDGHHVSLNFHNRF